MQNINIGKSGIAVPFLGMGTWAIGGGAWWGDNDDALSVKAIQTAVEQGITTGKTATTFDPNGPCTRGQAVPFLWRAAGTPEPKGSTMPFTSGASGSYCEKAVLWAVENGITNGIGDGLFGPDNSCPRAQIVTFLFRAYQGK